ncbi:stalk domain-containing protein [Paenibacillus sp. VCA1]|uniref:stalk domain-containing protein n=1 Tax=Paenibacillus sp. VCA1 TaxID=3039148 RepID=UPI0028722606|nr:stalk domain-containing protein [Paenibacillus sp. VCA1]MDR9854980.1 stalk domain-containing protein [Paenibacillus sp. VCA1]
MKTKPKFRKPFYLSLAIMLFLFSISHVNRAEAASMYAVYINHSGQIDNTLLIGNVNYIPLKTSFEKLGYHVEWSQTDRSLYLVSPDKSIIVNTAAKQVKSDDNSSTSFNKEILNNNGITYITAKYLSQLTDSQINVEGKSVRILNENVPIFGETPDGTFWLHNNGRFYSLKNKTAKMIGKINLLSETPPRYSSMSIQRIQNANSFVITMNTFSGEPLINAHTIIIFIKNDEIIHSVIHGRGETSETSKNGTNWVFNDGKLVNFINDHGNIVKTYDLTQIIEDDSYTIDGFIGEEFILVQSASKKLLWAVNMKTNKSVRLYTKLLNKEEQASIEGNTDIHDMHYGDNLHFKSISGDTLIFNYFSYLQGAKDLSITIKLNEFRNFFTEE